MIRWRAVRVIAGSVLLEAVRRRELYVIVSVCGALAAAVMGMEFFGLGGLVKFHRELSLKLMGVSTALTAVLLAVRQLPREFESRTVYPLLARPVGRFAFLLGKGLGVSIAAAFCLALFMVIYAVGIFRLGGDIGWGLFLQHLYLQMLQILLLISACFLLSLAFTHDAALVIALLLYAASGLISSASLALYPLTSAAGRAALWLLNYLLPQLALFDLSDKAVHSEIWSPLAAPVMLALTAYGLVYTGVFTAGAYALFRRRPL